MSDGAPDLEALLRWAEDYYPSRAIEPPDIAALHLSEVDLIEVFARVSSRRAYHALVDQPAIRHRLADPMLADAALAAWRRSDPAAKDAPSG